MTKTGHGVRGGATGRGNKIEPSKRMQCVEGQSAWRPALAAQDACRIKKKHVGTEHPIGIMWKIPFRMGGPWMQRHCAQADGLSLPFSDSLSLSLSLSLYLCVLGPGETYREHATERDSRFVPLIHSDASEPMVIFQMSAFRPRQART